jgi:hypothetical protein
MILKSKIKHNGMKNNNEFNYRDSLRSNDKGIFRYGTIGMVFGSTNPYKKESLNWPSVEPVLPI